MSNTLFDAYRLNEDGLKKADHISFLFGKLHDDLTKICPSANSREFSLAKTKLEEACFYAKKSMALVDKNQSK